MDTTARSARTGKGSMKLVGVFMAGMLSAIGMIVLWVADDVWGQKYT